MKLNKTLNEQSIEDGSSLHNNTVISIAKYQLPFSYLDDAEFSGQYLQISKIGLQPYEQYSTMTFYQQQTNSTTKSSMNEKRKSVLKKIIELKQKQIKIIRLPKMEADKNIVIQIKKSNQTLIARLPTQLQTTKTPLYNKQRELIGFLSYRLNQGTPKGQNEEKEEQEEYEQWSENQQPKDTGTQYLKELNKIQEEEPQKQQTKQQKKSDSNKLHSEIAIIVDASKINQSMDSSNEFLPKQKKQITFSAENKQPRQMDKQQQKINDLQENSILEKHHLPKMILPDLKKEAGKQPQTQPEQKAKSEVKQQNKQRKKQDQKQSREENRLLIKLRQLQNKTMAEKAKMQEDQKIKQNNRFKLNRFQFSQDKKSQKDHHSQQQQTQSIKVSPTSKPYKLPVQFTIQAKQEQPTSVTENTLPSNIPIQFSGRSYLQKHFKQAIPKKSQNSITSNQTNSLPSGRITNLQKKLFRKPGFITSHHKGKESSQQIKHFSIARKRQDKPKEIEFISIPKKSQSQEKQNSSRFNNQKLKLKVSRNILNITVNEHLKKRSLTKVIDQTFFPIPPQKKPEVEKQTQKQKSQTIQGQLFQKTKQKDKTYQNTKKVNKLQNLSLKSEASTPIEQQQYTFDIIISNLSVNLYNKAFGKKFLQLSQGRQLFTTDSLHGSHLLWVNRGYLFKNVLSADYIEVCLKCEVDSYLKILGKARINIDELLLNYKQSFYQTYLYSPTNELLAVIILGYEIFNHLKLSPKLQSDNLPVTMAKKKMKKLQRAEFKLPHLVTQDNSRISLQKSKYKKYKGGHNIRIGRQGRFNTEYTDEQPGPGYYNVISDFDRHTVSRKEK